MLPIYLKKILSKISFISSEHYICNKPAYVHDCPRPNGRNNRITQDAVDHIRLEFLCKQIVKNSVAYVYIQVGMNEGKTNQSNLSKHGPFNLKLPSFRPRLKLLPLHRRFQSNIMLKYADDSDLVVHYYLRNEI